MWDFLLDVFFPRTCLSCGKFGAFLCLNCQENIKLKTKSSCPYCKEPSKNGLTHLKCQKDLGLDGLFVWADYSGPIPKVIHAIKYQGVYGALGEIALLMMARYHNEFDFDYLVPVPLSKKRERDRGFNQAEILAKKIRGELRKKSDTQDFTVEKIIERVRDTKPQFDLGYEEREHNLKDAFRVSPSIKTTAKSEKMLTGLSFCLVDDVATTGTTLFECAKVLKISGADKVYALTIARGG